MAIQRIPHVRWKELGEKLGLASEDIKLLTQAKPQDKQSLNDVIQRWLRTKPSEALSTLTGVLVDMNLHTIASLLLQQSDGDSRWLK